MDNAGLFLRECLKSLFRLLHHSFVRTLDLLFMNSVDLMDQREISASWRTCLNHKPCQRAEGSQITDSRLPDGGTWAKR
jgi:hypothetical protein